MINQLFRKFTTETELPNLADQVKIRTQHPGYKTVKNAAISIHEDGFHVDQDLNYQGQVDILII